ncbi:MAG: hypothetical protein Q4G14_06975 [Paracoccus sp. (in: a-proteobacteria)]|uniref:hypothetical protein n=1 Tax=Paracoccus sp. TaxID=267 RepID=UPI0026DF7008|nr:hypothetical protein [Paracoccus sp. (in: a-proteobacteria)]MDO5612970.1 hypothetical protein [Paracoccus sp. (in: a-proteobacteria)]
MVNWLNIFCPQAPIRRDGLRQVIRAACGGCLAGLEFFKAVQFSDKIMQFQMDVWHCHSGVRRGAMAACGSFAPFLPRN